MRYKIMNKMVLGLLLILSACRAGISTENSSGCYSEEADANSIDAVLSQLKQKTAELKTYQCYVEYEVNQPAFETKTLRKGILYYAKLGKVSKLRVNFQTLKQDDEKEQKSAEHYIFDGIWLTRIIYPIKKVERRQLTEPNELADPFELVGRDLPVIGFTKIEDLKKQFEIKLVPSAAEGLVQPILSRVEGQKKDEAENYFHLRLKVKPDSIYKDDYTTIDFWIDKKLGLPAEVVAVATDPEPPFADIYQIRFLQPEVNKKIDSKVFKFDIPKDFTVETIPLQKQETEAEGTEIRR